MKKLQVGLLVLAAAMAAGPASAQDAGKWSHSGAFSGASNFSFGKGTLEDYWNDAMVKSTAGAATLRLAYTKRSWDLSVGFMAKEIGAQELMFRFNWMEDWAGFKAATQLGLDATKPPPSALETFQASLLSAWAFPLERQLEIRFAYNDSSAAAVYSVSWPTGSRELGAMPSGYPFRVVASPYSVPFPFKIGGVFPLPLAKDEPIVLSDKFLGESHLFAGADLSGLGSLSLILRAGAWLAPEESASSARLFTYGKLGGLPLGLVLTEVFEPGEMNHWEEKGTLSNTLALEGIPLPVTSVKLTASHVLTYNIASESMRNRFELKSDFNIGPVNLKPKASYAISTPTKMDEFQSELAASYKLAPLPGLGEGSGLQADLLLAEEGIHSHLVPVKIPPTIVTIMPSVGFWTQLIPQNLIFQIKPGAPLIFNLTNPDEDSLTLSCRALLALNLKPKASVAYDSGYAGGGSNTVWLAYSTGYDLKENEFVSGSMTLAFKIAW